MAIAKSAAATCLLLLGGVAAGLTFGRLTAHPASTPHVETLVAAAAEAIDADRLDRLWDLLDSNTRTAFGEAHRALLENAADWAARRPSIAPASFYDGAIREFEALHGMSLQEILVSTPSSAWVHHVDRRLGPRDRRPAFRSGVIEECQEMDGRAAVRVRLPDGRVQGLHLVRRDSGWDLLDFQPYCDVRRAAAPQTAAEGRR